MARAKKNPKAKRNPKAAKAEFPYRKQDDTALKDGAQVARARYYSSVRSTAKDILGEHGDDEDSISERISEDADSAVTMYKDAFEIVQLSDSTDAIEDVYGDDPASWGAKNVNDVITKIAYFAYERDLQEAIASIREHGE